MLKANSFNAYFSGISNDLKPVLVQVIMGKPSGVTNCSFQN